MLDFARLPTEELIALIVTTSFAAGLNVYAAALTIGLLAHAGFLVLPGPLELLANWWVVGACGALFALEFVADKIPALDLAWNVLQTVVRVPAGALLGYGAATSLSPAQQALAAALGAGIAFAAHTGKTAVRTVTTVEPMTNSAISITEDVVAIGLTWFATEHPYIAAGIVVALLALMALAIRAIIRAYRSLFRRAANAAE